MHTYSQEDWEFDCAPAPQKGLVADDARAQYILLPSDMAMWYMIRLDVMSDGSWLEAGKFVLRPGSAVLTLDRPVKYNSTVILTHRRKPALGSICRISVDRCALDEQLKVLEQHQNARSQSHDKASLQNNSCDDSPTRTHSEPTVVNGERSPRAEEWATSVSTDDNDAEAHLQPLPERFKIAPLHHTGLSSQNSTPTLHQPFSQGNHPQREFYALEDAVLNLSYHGDGYRNNGMSNGRGYKAEEETQTADGEDTVALTKTIGVLQGEVHRLTKSLTEMRTRMDNMKQALTLNKNPIYSYITHVDPEPTELKQSRHTFDIKAHKNPLVDKNRNVSDSRRRKNYNRSSSHTTDSYGSDMDGDTDTVSIGSGITRIPRKVYEQIDWNSYTIATRKLLMAVFPRRTLATHSLTGKASPAFMSKPAKLRLDIKKVSDIVMTVVENCGVREGLVRSCITTKCADENKMYRMRLRKKDSKNTRAPSHRDQENCPPNDSDSDMEPQYMTAGGSYTPHHLARKL